MSSSTVSTEKWKKIKGSNPAWTISNTGKVAYRGKEQRMWPKSQDYPELVSSVGFGKSSRVRKIKVIKYMVAECFIGSPPKSCSMLTHLDGDLANNHYTNLKWV